jgi:hypothetical protein
MSRENWPVRKLKLKDEGASEERPQLTAEENWAMMWQLALDAWAMRGEPVEPRLPRHIVRTIRGRDEQQ